MMKLYYIPMACSLASRIVLAETGEEAEFVQVARGSLALEGSGQRLDAISAKAKVPTLVYTDGRVVTENAAVLQYLADRAPASRLAPPASSPERVVLQEWLSFIGTEIHKAVLYPLYTDGSPPGAQEFARHCAPGALAIVSTRLGAAAHLVGDTFTIADAYLIWALILLRAAGIELDAVTADYLQRCLARPSVREALTIERRQAGL